MTVLIKKATCKQGVVEKADDIVVSTGAKSDSEGLVIIADKDAVYIPNDIEDRQKIIDELVELNKQTLELTKDLVKVITPIANAMVIPIPGQTGLPAGLIAGFTGGADFQTSINQIQSKLNQITSDCNNIKTNLK